MKNKMRNYIYIIGILAITFLSCKEEPIGQQPVDNVPPGKVSNVVVTNIAGGAVIQYELPADEDLLYVKALYTLTDGVESESRASVHTSFLIVEGFGDTSPKEVTLIAVDASRNESEAHIETINPLTPRVTEVGETLELVADFGGVHAYWENPTNAELAVILMLKDENEEYVPIDAYYSSMANGDGAKRGMDTISGDFAIYVMDRWENRSEIKYYTLTPLYETIFDRNLFRAIDLPNDAQAYAGGGSWGSKASMWNGEKANDSGYSTQGGTGIWPHSVTMDLGVTGLVSRLKLYHRMGGYQFGEGNPFIFEVWGCETLIDGNWDNWIKLMDCRSVKPSGLPLGQNTAEDNERATNGEDFINSPTNPKVRYLRINVLRTWGGGDNFQINELEIFGDNR